MATVVTRYIDPDVSGGSADGTSWANAYASSEIAQNAEKKDLTSSDEQYDFECRSSAGSADTTTVTFTGAWVTDATRFVRFYATSGHQALMTSFDTSRYRVKKFTTANKYLKFEGLQIYGVSWTSAMAFSTTAAGWIYLDGCRIEVAANGHGIDLIDADIDLYMWNSIVKSSTGNQIGMDIDAGDAYIYNSIVEGFATGFDIEAAAGTVEVKNVTCFNNTDDFSDANSSTIDYCASDDGDGTNAVAPSSSNWANEYPDYATGDYTLINTGNCYQGGADNPSSGLYTTDMSGDSYNSGAYSIGVDEYITISTGGVGTLLSGLLGGKLNKRLVA